MIHLQQSINKLLSKPAEKSNSKLLQAVLLDAMVTACHGAPSNHATPKNGTERNEARRSALASPEESGSRQNH
jgi:hypothetical protein